VEWYKKLLMNKASSRSRGRGKKNMSIGASGIISLNK